jgi:hypothetical protein
MRNVCYKDTNMIPSTLPQAPFLLKGELYRYKIKNAFAASCKGIST